MTRFLGDLIDRRIPQVLGIYLAAGWGLLEFADWTEGRLATSLQLTDWVIAGWLLLLPIVALAAWRWGESKPAPSRTGDPPPPKSLAVLPFANLSESPDTEYLSDGISEELINCLSKCEGLHVVSRTSAFAYKGESRDVRSIGRELNVGSVLEGSIQVAGDRLRVTTQLVNVADGYHLWSERFDRDMQDVFAIEDEIADNVAHALQIILREDDGGGLARLPTRNVQAYEYFLRGRQFLHQTRRKSLEFASQMFGRAVALEPGYALAHVGIATSAAMISMFYPERREELNRADEASSRALELDPDLADAHAARGFVLFLRRQIDEAEEEFQTAIALDPKLYETYYYYGRACFQQGRLAEAARLFDTASRLREDYQSAFFAAQAREAQGAEAEARVAYTRALEVVEKHMDLNPDDPRAATMRAVSLCRLGKLEEGVHWAEQALAIDPEDAGVRYNVACLYSLEGMADEAIAALEEAIEVGFGNVEWIERDPDLDPLRKDPRFQRILERIRRQRSSTAP